MLSGLILIGRGLDQVFEVKIESRIESESSCELIVIFSFEGTIGETRSTFNTSGDDDGEVTPVPIPNTAVKLSCADDSWLETTCENM